MIFRLAPMSALIRGLTIVLLCLPVAMAVMAVLRGVTLLLPVVLLVVIYAWVWFHLRPRKFVVDGTDLHVVWPTRRRAIPRREISSVRTLGREELKREIGWGMRVGAGGLWGGFGWLWTGRRGLIHMYVSRTDRFVWIECGARRPWLITPERAEEFVRLLSAAPSATWPAARPRAS